MSKVNKLCVSLIVLGAYLAGMPKAQAQSDPQVSIADAARKSRELKKDASKPATVITNDTLEPPMPAAPATAPGVPAASAASNTNLTVAASPDATDGQAASDSTPQAAVGPSQQEKEAKAADTKALKQRIVEKQSEVDLAQRALSLASDDFYSRPDFSKDDEGKAKLDAMKNELAQKLDELAQLKAGVPADASSDEKPTEGQSQPASESSSGSQPPSESPSQPQTQPQPQQR